MIFGRRENLFMGQPAIGGIIIGGSGGGSGKDGKSLEFQWHR